MYGAGLKAATAQLLNVHLPKVLVKAGSDIGSPSKMAFDAVGTGPLQGTDISEAQNLLTADVPFVVHDVTFIDDEQSELLEGEHNEEECIDYRKYYINGTEAARDHLNVTPSTRARHSSISVSMFLNSVTHTPRPCARARSPSPHSAFSGIEEGYTCCARADIEGGDQQARAVLALAARGVCQYGTSSP